MYSVSVILRQRPSIGTDWAVLAETPLLRAAVSIQTLD